jgi:hypothetical protein
MYSKKRNSTKSAKKILKGGTRQIYIRNHVLAMFLTDLLNILQNPDTNLSETHMYKMYTQIIPETIPEHSNKKQAIFTWYFMILAGILTEKYEEEGNVFAIKGGRSIQLLVDGTHSSEDMDLKIIKTQHGLSKQEFAKILVSEFVHNIPPKHLSIKPPDETNDTRYKISLQESVTGQKDSKYTALVDIDFKELNCNKGEHSIDCKLKKILTRNESVRVVVDDTILKYNTYPISIQIKEKQELIHYYENEIYENVKENFPELNSTLQQNFKDFLISFQVYKQSLEGKMYEHKQAELLSQHLNKFISANPGFTESSIIKYFAKNKRTIESFIFFIEKFNRGLNGLMVPSRKEKEAIMKKKRADLFAKMSKAVIRAAHEKKERNKLEYEREIERRIRELHARIMHEVRDKYVQGRKERKQLRTQQQKAEDTRRKAEDTRRKAEDTRRKAEDERQKVEDERRKAEDTRLKAEDERRKAEHEALKRKQYEIKSREGEELLTSVFGPRRKGNVTFKINSNSKPRTYKKNKPVNKKPLNTNLLEKLGF